LSPAEVEGFVARTPSLTIGERAELVGRFLEDVPASEDFWSSLNQGAGYAQAGASAVQGIASLGQLFAGLAGRQDIARGFGQAAQVAGTAGQVVGGLNTAIQQGRTQVSSMLQGLRSGQVPQMPGPPLGGIPRAPAGAPAAGMPFAGAPAAGMPFAGAPAAGMPFAGAPAAGGGQFDATALISLLASNPQLQQALRAATVQGAPRAVELVVPTEGGGPRTVSLPLSHVMETIAEMAQRSSIELAEADESALPEYLVEPANPQARSSLVLHYFRLAGEAERFGEGLGEADEGFGEAVEAGF
jgi:hypothetical protein